jgi:hypothetical protein
MDLLSILFSNSKHLKVILLLRILFILHVRYLSQFLHFSSDMLLKISLSLLKIAWGFYWLCGWSQGCNFLIFKLFLFLLVKNLFLFDFSLLFNLLLLEFFQLFQFQPGSLNLFLLSFSLNFFLFFNELIFFDLLLDLLISFLFFLGFSFLSHSILQLFILFSLLSHHLSLFQVLFIDEEWVRMLSFRIHYWG